MPSCPLGNKQPTRATPTKRSGHFIKPTSPKSPVASASAFESLEGSDEEDSLAIDAKLDTSYLHANGNFVSSFLIYNTCSFDFYLFDAFV